MYPNTEYVPFKYEEIADVANNTGLGDFLNTAEDNSGYWQVSMHESMRNCWGMEWGGIAWGWEHLPFRLVLACRL